MEILYPLLGLGQNQLQNQSQSVVNEVHSYQNLVIQLANGTNITTVVVSSSSGNTDGGGNGDSGTSIYNGSTKPYVTDSPVSGGSQALSEADGGSGGGTEGGTTGGSGGGTDGGTTGGSDGGSAFGSGGGTTGGSDSGAASGSGGGTDGGTTGGSNSVTISGIGDGIAGGTAGETADGTNSGTASGTTGGSGGGTAGGSSDTGTSSGTTGGSSAGGTSVGSSEGGTSGGAADGSSGSSGTLSTVALPSQGGEGGEGGGTGADVGGGGGGGGGGGTGGGSGDESEPVNMRPAVYRCNERGGEMTTNFVNPSYPYRDTVAGICMFRLDLAPRVCQVRVDVVETNLAPPTEGVCVRQYLTAQGSIWRPGVQRICGTNSDTHFYLEVEADGKAKPYIEVAVSSQPGLSYRWGLWITQVDCQLPSPIKAPPGCFQYYPEASGELKNFSFDDGQYYVDQHYRMCLLAPARTCSVTFSARAGAFMLEKYGNIDEVPYNMSGMSSLYCVRDYLRIPDGSADGGALTSSHDRYCGGHLASTHGAAAPSPVTSRVMSKIVAVEFHAGIPHKFMAISHGPGFKVAYQHNHCAAKHSSNRLSLINTSFSTTAAFEEYGRIDCCRNSNVTVAEEAEA
ncbi:uncharacterized protein LOC122250861 [Penaeus japonicus]|uniref:uncharacterized protein LOC122250861 n=1 Tax=Penaeus japonicus TaxID=27405 RepID=UPI001C716DEE|nr:uncharacterized protein LOC122250861 [Penaeus japonicus]